MVVQRLRCGLLRRGRTGHGTLTRASCVALVLCLLTLHMSVLRAVAAEERESSAIRLLDAVRVLAADEMEGRGPGTRGIDLAAQYIADQFAGIGLRTDLFDGTAFQPFDLPAPPELGAPGENRLILSGPSQGEGSEPTRVVCALGRDFNTLAAGSSGSAHAPLVFVGYGITAPDWNYDDYAEIDIQGKVVVMLRKEPQQGDATSIFDGLQPSEHAAFQRKIQNAQAHGAAAVIIVNDAYSLSRRSARQRKDWEQAVTALTSAVADFQQLATWTDDTIRQTQTRLAELAQTVTQRRQAADSDTDELVEFRDAGLPSNGVTIPVFFCRRSVLDPIVSRALGTDLASLEQQIDQGPTPRSRALEGWTAECQSSIRSVRYHLKNVVGVLDGQGPLADETIVIGAHYDHLGRGPSGDGDIYNGADDNASGVSGMLEIAHRLVTHQEPSRRRIVFVAFAGEELGLRGSAHYVQNPPFPLDQTVAMFCLDMIGRLRDNRLTIGGTGSAVEFDALIDEFNQTYQFQIARVPNGQGPSDHASFYRQKVPVLFFFTNDHEDYHRPTDDVEKINVDGMLSVTHLVTDIVSRLDDAPQRPTYQETVRPSRGVRGAPRAYLGCVPDASRAGEGVVFASVVPESPAAQAGLQAADILVKLGEIDIRSYADLNRALRSHRPGDEVAVQVRRGGDTVTRTVTLGEPR